MAGKRTVDPLARGFYTVPEAARLIRVGSARRIFGWLRGYPGRDIGPLLARDYQPIGDNEELSFLDLMEVRFVEHLRDHGVKLRALRLAADRLRRDYKTAHPFALKDVLIVADKVDVYVKEVLRESAEAVGDIRLRSLVTNNYVMYEAIKRSLLPGVEFDALTRLASEWKPIPNRFPNILIDPRRAYGKPILPAGIPTEVLFDAWKRENENADAVAYWFKVSVSDVAHAIAFEQALDMPIQSEAA